MKNTHLTTLITIILLSGCCSESDTILITQKQEETQQIDFTTISEYHKIHNDGNVSIKYIFNIQGLLSQYYNLNSSYTINYFYDSNNKLVNISKKELNGNLIDEKNIYYDNNDRIIKVNQLDYIYHQAGDYYHTGEGYYTPIITITNYNGDDIESSLREYSTYKDSNLDGIFEYCHYYDSELTNLTTGQYIGNDLEEYCESSTFNFYWHDGENLTASNEYNRRTYDSNINPLHNDNSNIKYVIGFLHSDYAYGEIYPEIISKNNIIYFEADIDGPEDTSYEYDFNNYSLPINRYSQQYYNSDTEGNQQYLSAKYYYQGDVIPE